MSKIHITAANSDALTARLIDEAMQADHKRLALFHRITGEPPPSRRDEAGWRRLRDRYEPIAGHPLLTPDDVVDFVISLADELDAEAARTNAAELNAGKSPDEAVANEGKSNVGEPGVRGGVDAEAYLPPARLAELFGVPAEALRARLNRWRSRHDGGWIENPDRAPRAAKYLYSATTVRPICESLRATSQRPATKNKSARSKD